MESVKEYIDSFILSHELYPSKNLHIICEMEAAQNFKYRYYFSGKDLHLHVDIGKKKIKTKFLIIDPTENIEIKKKLLKYYLKKIDHKKRFIEINIEFKDEKKFKSFLSYILD